jgi:hypothetical protein
MFRSHNTCSIPNKDTQLHLYHYPVFHIYDWHPSGDRYTPKLNEDNSVNIPTGYEAVRPGFDFGQGKDTSSRHHNLIGLTLLLNYTDYIIP